MNPWFPSGSQDILLDLVNRDGRRHYPQLRVEDEDDRLTLFAAPRLKEDGFQLALSLNPPSIFMSGSPSAFQIRIGTQTLDLILREDGRLGLEGIFAKLGRKSCEVEIKAFQAGNIVHRELAQFWLEEDDVTIFAGRSGKRVRDLRTFVPEMPISVGLRIVAGCRSCRLRVRIPHRLAVT